MRKEYYLKVEADSPRELNETLAAANTLGFECKVSGEGGRYDIVITIEVEDSE